ncbi:MAG: FAD-dependent oxidoreductase [Deltaproteobacteria bacterium]|nr:FAD-dependent oxidoreductase [Deltaproteobacteria bacterium]
MDNHVAVIGAGMAGLGAAYSLRQQGIPCTVFEPGKKAGGRMTTEKIGDFHVDTGASFVVKYFKAVSDLVHEIGMQDEMRVLARNAASLYRDGKFHTVSMSNPFTALTFRGVSLKSQLSMIGVLPDYLKHFFKVNSFLNAYKGVAIDDENAYDWLKRRTSQELADYLGDPVCRALCMYPLKDMSKLNFMAYSLSVLNMKLYSFREGMGSVPARLSRDLDIRYGARVTSVEQKGGRVEVSWSDGNRTQTGDYAAAVVAVWGDLVPEIVKGLSPLETEIFSSTQYSTTWPVAITTDVPIHNPFYGVYISPGESECLASFGIEDAKGNQNVPPGKGCLFCVTKEEFVRSFKGTREQFGEIVARDAVKFFPYIQGHITGIHVFRWDRAVEKMPPGRFSILHGLNTQWPKDRRVFVAGAYLIAPCTDGAFTSGRQAAEKVAKVLN